MKKKQKVKGNRREWEDEWCTDDIWAETQANRKEQRPSSRSCFKKKEGGYGWVINSLEFKVIK